jgi:hypothetical protein
LFETSWKTVGNMVGTLKYIEKGIPPYMTLKASIKKRMGKSAINDKLLHWDLF